MEQIASKSPVEFTSAAVAVGSSTNYVQVARIMCYGRDVLIVGKVGAGGALGHLRITQAARVDGVHNTLAEDADLNAGNEGVGYSLPANAYQTAANGQFQILLRARAGEYIVEAKMATVETTLQISGSIL